MIGICIKGKSPDGCITYILNDKKVKSESSFKDRSVVLVYNNCYGETKEIIGQFQQVMQLNKKLSDPILHIILSLAPGENLNSNQLVDLTYCCAQKFNFSDNIYLSAFHKDTIDRQHIHICASRIGYDKKTVSDSNDFKRMAEFCREMEIKFGLQKVLSPRAFLPKEQRDLPRYDKRKEFLKESIIGSLKEAENFEIFQIKMAEKGFKVLKSRGISFVDHEGVITKGSSVSYSLMKIESTLKSNQGDQEDVPKIRIRIPEKMSFEKSGFAILNDPQRAT